MRAAPAWERIGARLAATPSMTIAVAAALIVISLILAVYNERLGQAETLQQARVQAEILAGSVAAPLAFDDRSAAQEYVNSLRANPAVEAAGAYDAKGALAAAFRRAGPPAPAANALHPPVLAGGRLTVTAAVSQGTTRLGSVYLRVATRQVWRRVGRYFGIGAVVILSSLLVAVLGASHAALRESHRRLQAEVRERERAEEALRQSQKMEAMGQLTGGVAHDFNNLLMVASGGLEMLDRTTDPTRRQRLKDGIRQALDRGAALTAQLLAFSRKAPLRGEVVDLGVIISGLTVLLERSLREDIDMKLRIASDLWPVETDPAQLEVVLLNLAVNARDAMPNGGAITLTAENQAAGPDAVGAADRVRISVADTGVGIPPELISRIFEPFFTTKGVGKGTGLGLSQAYGFARASGGEVQVESEPGRGTTISLVLPRSLKPLPMVQQAPAPTTRAPRQGADVLLVEDDDAVAGAVTAMLEELGYRVRRAAAGLEALELLATGPRPDVVFSDMVMPGAINGIELAREIGRRHPGLRVVLTTGFSEAAAAAAAEGLTVLPKPYRIDILGAALAAQA